ncbi:MAG: DMT family transporter [Alcaligenaceae bacterium]|nr:DMT family transporter [Alcaligenaceae bacterium]
MRKAVDSTATAIMVALCLIWGIQQVAMKAVAADIAPVLQVALRSGVAAVLVLLFTLLISRDQWLKGVALRSGLVVGLLFATEFMLVAEGLRWTSASHMVVFLYTAPLFAAIGLHLRLPEERLNLRQWLGMGLAFIGLSITFLLTPQANDATIPNQLLGDFLGLCGGFAWGMTTVAVRISRLSEAPPTQTLFYQLLGGFIFLMPVAFLTGQYTFNSTPLVWISLAYQTLIISCTTYFVWIWLMRKYLTARLGVLSFMTPMFGVLLGILLLDEPLEPAFLLGSALTLSGLVIVNSAGKRN